MHQAASASGVDSFRKSDALNQRDFGEAKTISRAACSKLQVHSDNQKLAADGTLEYCMAELSIREAWADLAAANVLGYPFTSGPEYQARVDNKEAALASVSRAKAIIEGVFPGALKGRSTSPASDPARNADRTAQAVVPA